MRQSRIRRGVSRKPPLRAETSPLADRDRLIDVLRERLSARSPDAARRCDGPARESAVLVPILWRPDARPRCCTSCGAPMPRRTRPDRVSRWQARADDPTLSHPALRESFEEVGLPAEQVSVCGLLDDVPTPAGFNITPVVGVVQAPRRDGAALFTQSARSCRSVCRPSVARFASIYQLAGHTSGRACAMRCTSSTFRIPLCPPRGESGARRRASRSNF